MGWKLRATGDTRACLHIWSHALSITVEKSSAFQSPLGFCLDTIMAAGLQDYPLPHSHILSSTCGIPVLKSRTFQKASIGTSLYFFHKQSLLYMQHNTLFQFPFSNEPPSAAIIGTKWNNRESTLINKIKMRRGLDMIWIFGRDFAMCCWNVSSDPLR